MGKSLQKCKACCLKRLKKLDSVSAAEVDIPEDANPLKKFLAFFGPGILVAIAYIDPGNFATDLQAGAQFQYMMIWVMVASTIIGFFLQLLSAKLGIATGHDLATSCRITYNRPVRYALWVTTEVAVIASDVPEVIGTAFALKILFGLPLWIGVVITAIDTLIFLAVNFFGVRMLELVIGLFVAVISVSFVIEVFGSGAPAGLVFEGFIPRMSGSAAYTAVSLLGAVVMPHNLFLHSALVGSRKFGKTDEKKKEAILYNGIESGVSLAISLIINVSVIVVAGAKFYPDFPDADLESASSLLETLYGGKWAAILFGIALLASGQSSTMTGTYAGQFVMEGFMNWKIAVWKRNLITRSIAMVPSLIVALVAGEQGSSALIVLSSVILSIQLPYTMVPMLKITSSERRMGAHKNSLPIAIAGWGLGALVMAANIYLISTQIAEIPGIFDTDLARLGFAGICALAFVYFLFLVYLVYLPVDDVIVSELPESKTAGVDEENQKLLQNEDTGKVVGYGSSSGADVTVN